MVGTSIPCKTETAAVFSRGGFYIYIFKMAFLRLIFLINKVFTNIY